MGILSSSSEDDSRLAPEASIIDLSSPPGLDIIMPNLGELGLFGESRAWLATGDDGPEADSSS